MVVGPPGPAVPWLTRLSVERPWLVMVLTMIITGDPTRLTLTGMLLRPVVG
jgi:hypothetical protein